MFSPPVGTQACSFHHCGTVRCSLHQYDTLWCSLPRWAHYDVFITDMEHSRVPSTNGNTVLLPPPMGNNIMFLSPVGNTMMFSWAMEHPMTFPPPKGNIWCGCHDLGPRSGTGISHVVDIQHLRLVLYFTHDRFIRGASAGVSVIVRVWWIWKKNVWKVFLFRRYVEEFRKQLIQRLRTTLPH